ncbi:MULTISPECIES: hypothetical protein [unclassified Isoptericola]|uniref:hypothetical protein n=1 Tax=unclassified Isoptericola TaxID=2623355 RepID=UPI0036496ABB
MRTPAVLGASLLLLASLAAAGPAVAGERVPWEGPGDSRTGSEWDGGSATWEGTTYSWPENTRSWDDDTCPDMDVKKTNTSGDPETLEIVAPEGKLISAYCIKSASAKQGEGPKIVTLDEPVATLTIAYPTVNGGGKSICRGISHYAVAYVDVTTPTETTPPTDEETTPPAEETTPPAEETTPPTDEETTPPAEPTPPTDEETTPPAEPTPSDTPSTLPTAPTDGSTPGMGGADYEDEGTVVDDAAATGDEVVGAPQEQAEATAAPESLPVTGAQVLGMAMAAVALLGAGVGAMIWVRQRRAS